ncbi:hypothetical protein ZIOFF_031757 [Zingiber officinale]|uniref:Uncharacterized protein n=1 Tax=Zingiber officinale TaxID=94328 RepID=A0A8J5L0K3_ZINOF|nr:hypothetical protein ZIOFF_031757 [Zingiber officinale]
MFIKTKISDGIRGSLEHYDNVRDSLKAIDDQFVSSDKALASTLIHQFSSMKLSGIHGVRDHIMRMRDIAAQLKRLEDCFDSSCGGDVEKMDEMLLLQILLMIMRFDSNVGSYRARGDHDCWAETCEEEEEQSIATPYFTADHRSSFIHRGQGIYLPRPSSSPPSLEAPAVIISIARNFIFPSVVHTASHLHNPPKVKGILFLLHLIILHSTGAPFHGEARGFPTSATSGESLACLYHRRYTLIPRSSSYI